MSIRGMCFSTLASPHQLRPSFLGRLPACTAFPSGLMRLQGQSYRSRWMSSDGRSRSWVRRKLFAEPTDSAEAVEVSGTPVKINCLASVGFGEKMRIVGGCEALGNWDVANAVDMEWGPGDIWTSTVVLQPGVYELKCVKVGVSGGADWEPGENRVVEVAQVSDPSELVIVDCEFFDIESTSAAVVSYDEEDVEEDETLTEQTTLEVEKTEKTVSEASAGSVSGRADASADQNIEPESAQEPAIVATSTSGNSIENAAEAEEAPQFSKPDAVSDPATDALQKNKSVNREEKGSNQPEKSKDPSTRSATLSSPAAAKMNMSAPKESKASVSWASVCGLLSIPTVLWSEYTLKSTGCGLEPGPGGLLGALEGISYLGVCISAVWFISQRFVSNSKNEGLNLGVEASSYLTICCGLIVLALQIQDYGYIPSALPDNNCPSQPTAIDFSWIQLSAESIVPINDASTKRLLGTPAAPSPRQAQAPNTTYSVSLPVPDEDKVEKD